MADEKKVQKSEPKADDKPKADQSVRVRLLRDVWDENAVRQHAGTEVEMPVDRAIDLIEAGRVQRVK